MCNQRSCSGALSLAIKPPIPTFGICASDTSIHHHDPVVETLALKTLQDRVEFLHYEILQRFNPTTNHWKKKRRKKKRITTKTTAGSQFSTTRRRRRRRRRNLEGTKFSKRRKGKERSPLLT